MVRSRNVGVGMVVGEVRFRDSLAELGIEGNGSLRRRQRGNLTVITVIKTYGKVIYVGDALEQSVQGMWRIGRRIN